MGSNVRQQDLIVISPGVPVNAPALEPARKQKIPIIGEVELASRFLKGKLVAITGSNGKTTTTALAGDVIAAGGGKTLVGGNIGTRQFHWPGRVRTRVPRCWRFRVSNWKRSRNSIRGWRWC